MTSSALSLARPSGRDVAVLVLALLGSIIAICIWVVGKYLLRKNDKEMRRIESERRLHPGYRSSKLQSESKYILAQAGSFLHALAWLSAIAGVLHIVLSAIDQSKAHPKCKAYDKGAAVGLSVLNAGVATLLAVLERREFVSGETKGEPLTLWGVRATRVSQVIVLVHVVAVTALSVPALIVCPAAENSRIIRGDLLVPYYTLALVTIVFVVFSALSIAYCNSFGLQTGLHSWALSVQWIVALGASIATAVLVERYNTGSTTISQRIKITTAGLHSIVFGAQFLLIVHRLFFDGRVRNLRGWEPQFIEITHYAAKKAASNVASDAASNA